MLTVKQGGFNFRIHCDGKTFEVANADGNLQAWGRVDPTTGEAHHIEMWDGVRANNRLRPAIVKVLTVQNLALAYIYSEVRTAAVMGTTIADEDTRPFARPMLAGLAVALGTNVNTPNTAKYRNMRTGEQMDAWEFAKWSKTELAAGRRVAVVETLLNKSAQTFKGGAQ